MDTLSNIDTGRNVDAGEIAKFDALAAQWWDPDGPLRPLHRLNPTRLRYIRDQIDRHLGPGPSTRQPLTGRKVLDVGCGCGLVAEPLCRLGASVTAIDPSQRNIEVARAHGLAQGLDIDYRPTDTAAMLAKQVETFDLVTCLEVIEHTPDGDVLAFDLAELTRPGGVLIMSTINRTAMSFVKAIVGAEYLLGWLPRGTHRWRRFVRPSELARWLRSAGFRVTDITGITWDPLRDEFQLAGDRSVNYLLTAVRG